MTKHWADFRKIFKLQTDNDLDLIYHYWGSDVSFYYAWMNEQIVCNIPIAFLGLIVQILI